MYVYMHVCNKMRRIYAHIHACMFGCMYVCTWQWNACMCACKCACSHVRIDVCHTCVRVCMHACKYAFTFVNANVRLFVHVCLHGHIMHACVHAWMCALMCANDLVNAWDASNARNGDTMCVIWNWRPQTYWFLLSNGSIYCCRGASTARSWIKCIDAKKAMRPLPCQPNFSTFVLPQQRFHRWCLGLTTHDALHHVDQFGLLVWFSHVWAPANMQQNIQATTVVMHQGNNGQLMQKSEPNPFQHKAPHATEKFEESTKRDWKPNAKINSQKQTPPRMGETLLFHPLCWSTSRIVETVFSMHVLIPIAIHGAIVVPINQQCVHLQNVAALNHIAFQNMVAPIVNKHKIYISTREPTTVFRASSLDTNKKTNQ